MRFMRGMILGATIGVGITMMCADGKISAKNMLKKGKQMARKMGF